jgi:hypothetical protein
MHWAPLTNRCEGRALAPMTKLASTLAQHATSAYADLLYSTVVETPTASVEPPTEAVSNIRTINVSILIIPLVFLVR